MRRFLGIDPGADGGYAACVDGAIERAAAFPRLGDNIDWSALTIELLRDRFDGVVIEKVGAMPGQGVTSMFNFGRNVGALHCIFESRGLPLRLVTPQAWKKVILAGTDRDKAAAASYVLRTHPHIDLRRNERCRSPHDGMADAVCIAEYGYRTFA
jgi:crossover junction endodeoxyribonuclease RuvC